MNLDPELKALGRAMLKRISACGWYLHQHRCKGLIVESGHCRSRACPGCASTRNKPRMSIWATEIHSWLNPRHMILTIRSRKSLEESLDILRASFRRLRQQQIWRSVPRWLMSVGLTFSRGLWNVHLHIAYDSELSIFVNDSWIKATNGEGLQSFDRRWTSGAFRLSRELIQGTKNDLRELQSRFKRDPGLLGEFLTATKGRRMFESAPGTKPAKATTRKRINKVVDVMRGKDVSRSIGSLRVCPHCLEVCHTRHMKTSRIDNVLADSLVKSGAAVLGFKGVNVLEEPETNDDDDDKLPGSYERAEVPLGDLNQYVNSEEYPDIERITTPDIERITTPEIDGLDEAPMIHVTPQETPIPGELFPNPVNKCVKCGCTIAQVHPATCEECNGPLCSSCDRIYAHCCPLCRSEVRGQKGIK